MHEGEFSVTPLGVRRLLAAQMPDLAGLPLRRLADTGTDNVLFRLGRHLLRLPRHPEAAAQIAVMQRVAALGLAVPMPRVLRVGEASDLFPMAFAVTSFLPGRVPEALVPEAARALADVVLALRDCSPEGPERPPLEPRLQGLEDRRVEEVSAPVLARLVARAQAMRPVDRRVWEHGDLHAFNLLVVRDRLSGVLDWGSAGVGDGTADLLPAFMAMEAKAADLYLSRLGASGAEVERGFALALQKCVLGLPYYRVSNPRFHRLLRATLSRLVAF